jgi:aminoglycoside phosphotransferase (APT) family kinase protein
VINSIYLLGQEFVLRIPRNHEGTVAQARTEAIAAPMARAAGVRTPRLIAYDDSCDLLPVPYTIYERVHGRTLGLLDWEPAETHLVWHELGRDLALLHTGVSADGPAGRLREAEDWPDPRALVEERAIDGWFTGLEVRWFTRWLDRISPAATIPTPRRMLHLDIQATNVMLRDDAFAYSALLDWGCAGLGDAASDFCGIPMRVVPTMLEGHRSIAPLDADDGAEARILWRHLQIALAMLPRGAVPGMSWGERPLAWLLDIFRFFAESPGPRWRDLRP